MIDHPEPDPLADLLRPQSGEAETTFRDTLLQWTRRSVRGRVWLQRLALVGSLAACFAAGAVVMSLFRPPDRIPDPVPPPIVQPPTQEPEPTALVLEDRAVQNAEERSVLFREAGQRYLRDEGDVQAAVRCYGHGLDLGTDADLTIRPEDDWLLMALKRARQEESRVHSE